MSIQKQGLRPLEDVIDEMIAEGYFKRIIEKYESIRVDETKLEVAEEMFKENYSIEEIAKITKLSKDVLSELLQKQ
jgi:hypothetical protein